MSILIKGMEMPGRCGSCPCFHAEHPIYCRAVKADRSKRIAAPYGLPRPDWCPLVEVPPHGRLIDADELLERFNVLQKQKDMYGREVSSCFEDSGSLCTDWWCVEEIVADAPTVIPADKDGEDGR